MKHLTNLVAPMAIVIAMIILFSACKKSPVPCHKVNAQGKGRIISQTAAGATTESVITGNGLQGTTIADLVFTDVDPVTGNLLFKGTLVLTNYKGTLTLNLVNGKFNTVTGEFSNDSDVIAGTGEYQGATGSLYFHGFTYPDGSFVDDKISGEICRSRSNTTSL